MDFDYNNFYSIWSWRNIFSLESEANENPRNFLDLVFTSLNLHDISTHFSGFNYFQPTSHLTDSEYSPTKISSTNFISKIKIQVKGLKGVCGTDLCSQCNKVNERNILGVFFVNLRFYPQLYSLTKT